MSVNRKGPPKWARKLFRFYCPTQLLEEIEGDLDENFQINSKRFGHSYARKQFIKDVILFFNSTTFRRSRAIKENNYSPAISITMFTNYLKTGLRNLARNKSTSIINILGLSIGIACFALAFIYVTDEFKFDLHHPHSSTIFRVVAERGGQDQSGHWASTSPAVVPTLKSEYPEVVDGLRLHQIRQKLLFKKAEYQQLEENGFFAESAIFNFFDIKIIQGDKKSILKKPDEVVISQDLAQKYFGNQNAVGELIEINNKAIEVSGVFENLSPYFHLQFDYLLSFERLLNQVSDERIKSWVWQDFSSYIRVTDGDLAADLDRKLTVFSEEYAHRETKPKGFHYYLSLQPLRDIHLKSSEFQNDVAIRGNYYYVIGLSMVGFFILILACINFINLSTARSIRRAKEVGVRKVTGATKSQIVLQFLTESFIVVSIATLIGVILTWLVLPLVNNFTSKSIFLLDFFKPTYLLGIILLVVLTTLLAGFYPSMIISGFRPGQSLKQLNQGRGGRTTWLRKGLVILQFTISVAMIISILVIFKQINFLQNGDLGFNRDHLVHFPMKGKMFSDFEKVKSEFQKVPGVRSVSTCFGIPGDIVAGDEIVVPGAERKTMPARIFAVDHHYISTMGMHLVAGRDFDVEIAMDAQQGFIINETAVTTLGLGSTPEAAIGKKLEWDMWSEHDTIKKGTVIGVIKDFHFQSLHDPIQTAVLHIYPDAYWKAAVRIDMDQNLEAISNLESTWQNFETGYPLDYQFVDESFGKMYQQESKLETMLKYLSLLALFIAGIGAYGLVSHSTEQRKKEIGIRRVLGANLTSIVSLLTFDFLKLVVYGILIATPIAWYLMTSWLADFAYRITIPWTAFVMAAFTVLVIAICTIGGKTLRAANAQPTDSLRQE